jgi:hypothetical protein
MQSIPICHLLRFESEPNINQGGSFDFVLINVGPYLQHDTTVSHFNISCSEKNMWFLGHHSLTGDLTVAKFSLLPT